MGYSYYYKPEYVSTGLTAIVVALGVFFIIFCLMLIVLQVIAYWKLFQKAGQPGWKSLIPFYSEYVLYGIAWKKSMFWVALATGAVSSIASTLLSSAITQLSIMGSITAFSVASTVFGILFMIACTVIALVIQIVFSVHLSRAFGHGGGYTIGLILLPTIFMLILGLGNSEYVRKEHPSLS